MAQRVKDPNIFFTPQNQDVISYRGVRRPETANILSKKLRPPVSRRSDADTFANEPWMPDIIIPCLKPNSLPEVCHFPAKSLPL
jgi:hypothetical protein